MVNMLLQSEESEWADDESEPCSIQSNDNESGDLAHQQCSYTVPLEESTCTKIEEMPVSSMHLTIKFKCTCHIDYNS